MPEVIYLGHRIDKEGFHPMEAKIAAILKVLALKNFAEFRAFLGLLNYYSKFLPNLSTMLVPLHKLLKNHTKQLWKAEQAEAFQEVKNLLQSPRVLVHYDSSRPLVLSCDTSPYGVGAVLLHIMDGNTERQWHSHPKHCQKLRLTMHT